MRKMLLAVLSAAMLVPLSAYADADGKKIESSSAPFLSGQELELRMSLGKSNGNEVLSALFLWELLRRLENGIHVNPPVTRDTRD